MANGQNVDGCQTLSVRNADVQSWNDFSHLCDWVNGQDIIIAKHTDYPEY